MKTTARFIRVENDQSITIKDYPAFYFDLQHAVLLSLKEAGMLTQIQYKHAVDILTKQQIASQDKRDENGGIS